MLRRMLPDIAGQYLYKCLMHTHPTLAEIPGQRLLQPAIIPAAHQAIYPLRTGVQQRAQQMRPEKAGGARQQYAARRLRLHGGRQGHVAGVPFRPGFRYMLLIRLFRFAARQQRRLCGRRGLRVELFQRHLPMAVIVLAEHAQGRQRGSTLFKKWNVGS